MTTKSSNDTDNLLKTEITDEVVIPTTILTAANPNESTISMSTRSKKQKLESCSISKGEMPTMESSLPSGIISVETESSEATVDPNVVVAEGSSESAVAVEYVQLEDYLTKNGIAFEQSTGIINGYENDNESTATTTTVILTSPSNHQQVLAALASMESQNPSVTTTTSTNESSNFHDYNIVEPPSNTAAIPDILPPSNSQFNKLLPNSPVPIQVVKPQQKQQISDQQQSHQIAAQVEIASDNNLRKRSNSRRKSSTSSTYSDNNGDAMNPSPPRRIKNPIPDVNKDEKYWRRRAKNNLAAKRSRESRREKENNVTMRAAFLEKEYQSISCEVAKAREINQMLKERLRKYESVDDIPDI